MEYSKGITHLNAFYFANDCKYAILTENYNVYRVTIKFPTIMV